MRETRTSARWRAFSSKCRYSFISTARWRALLAGLVSEVGMSLSSMASKGERSFNFTYFLRHPFRTVKRKVKYENYACEGGCLKLYLSIAVAQTVLLFAQRLTRAECSICEWNFRLMPQQWNLASVGLPEKIEF